MAFYLNRTGAAEGPFEEAQIVQMIQRGEVSNASICWVGHNQWSPLTSHPPFAHALSAPPQQYGGPHYGGPQGGAPGYGQAPPGGHGQAPPGGHGQAPPGGHGQASPGGYGQSPPGGYGAPAGGYGAPQQAYGPGPAAMASPVSPTIPGGPAGTAKTKSGGGGKILIFAVVGVAVLLLAGGAVGVYLFSKSLLGGDAPQISTCVPKDSEVLVEVPSIKKALADFKDVEYLESSWKDDKKAIDETVAAVSKAFDISETDTQALLLSLDSVGIAAQHVTTNPEGGFVVGFGRPAPVETLLASKRFTLLGTIGVAGKKYQLASKPVEPSAPANPASKSAALLRGLSEMSISGSDVLAWFPKGRVMVIGKEAYALAVGHVLEENAPSLEQNPKFQLVKGDFGDKSRVDVFVDHSIIGSIQDPKVREMLAGYFNPVTPMTGTVRIEKAGPIVHFSAKVTGTKLPKVQSAPGKLAIAERLPAETVAYGAFVSRAPITGAEFEKTLLDQIGATEPGARENFEKSLRQFEALLGVTVPKLYDSLGEQGAMAFVVPADFQLDLTQGPQALMRLGFIYVQELKDEAAFKTLSSGLRDKLLAQQFRDSAKITSDGPGFVLEPRNTPVPMSLRVKFVDHHLFIVGGANPVNDRAEAAFLRGERTLKGDAAHATARSALPSEVHAFFWVDTGRIADALNKSPALRVKSEELGIDLSQFKLTGDQRVTSAISVRAEIEQGSWRYSMDALNLHAFFPLGAGAAALTGGGLGGL